MSHASLSRREFLAAVGASASLPVAASVASVAPSGSSPLVIDCHAHIYSEDDKSYPPIARPYRPPAGKGTISHLRKEMQANGVRRATAIHTFTFY